MSSAFALVEAVPPLTQLKLAREIAADMRELPDILRLFEISNAQWDELQRSTRFQNLLSSAITEWQGVQNTAERVKLKSLAFVEEALPEFYARVHDQKETLSAKNEVLKTVSRLAGVGGPVDGSIVGERMVITINLGADQQLSFVKRQTVDLEEGEYQETGDEQFVPTESEDVTFASNLLEGVDVDANEELGSGVEDDGV